MQSAKKALSNEAFLASDAGLRFVLEPEPWLRIFARNVGDLFRKSPPPVWVSSAPGQYWPDALVHRPVAWKSARQSFLGHALVIIAIYALNLAWLDQPQALPQTPPNQTVVHYEVSEYLPPVNAQKAKPEPPRRARPQKADPELAPQEIVVTRENHISTRQTIVQPGSLTLRQDVPLPNLIASTEIPGAPMAMNHPMQVLPVNVPLIAEPAQPIVQSRLRPLLFPPAAQPQVAAPAEAPARRAMLSLPIEGAIVVPPAPDVTARKPDALQLPAQAPPQVAAPSPETATSHALQSIPLSMAAPQVAPPAPPSASRNLGNLGLPAPNAAAVPPAPPVANANAAQEKALGQMLVLNAQPIAPSRPLVVPEGNRPGEFAAGPTGHSGATARPEIAQRTSGNSGSPADIYVSAPPVKVASNAMVASAGSPPTARPLTADKTEPSHDSVDTRIFGTRRHYSMRLSMPNLTSSTGSWSIRFAELNATHGGADLSAPEAITKVDPAYPQDLMHDRVEGTVVLYAVIHADGSVGDVKILEGFDDRLNENARKALEQWRFRPGTKDGLPVDIEAVVRVPFKVPRREF